MIESITSNPESFDTFSTFVRPPPPNSTYADLENRAFNLSSNVELIGLDAGKEYNLTVRIDKSPDKCGVTDPFYLFNSKVVIVCTGT